MTMTADPGTRMEFPTSEKMRYAVALAAAALNEKRFDHLGAGTQADPLLDLDVQLTGRNGNAFSIMGAVHQAAKKWVRTQDSHDNWAAQHVVDAIMDELTDSQSYTELLYKASCLVNVS